MRAMSKPANRETWVGTVEHRAAEDDKTPSRQVRGYAAIFGAVADLGWFTEEIETGFFDEALASAELDVRALFNHDANLVLARLNGSTNSLKVGVDETGLWYEFDAPNTTAGNDLLENLRLSLVTQSSFGFTVEDARWDTKDGKDHRVLEKAGKLFDVSPVTFPAYTEASVALRDRNGALEALGIQDTAAATIRAALDLKANESPTPDLEILEREISIRKRK